MNNTVFLISCIHISIYIIKSNKYIYTMPIRTVHGKAIGRTCTTITNMLIVSLYLYVIYGYILKLRTIPNNCLWLHKKTLLLRLLFLIITICYYTIYLLCSRLPLSRSQPESFLLYPVGRRRSLRASRLWNPHNNDSDGYTANPRANRLFVQPLLGGPVIVHRQKGRADIFFFFLRQ